MTIEQAFGTLKRKFCIGRASYFYRLKVEGQLYMKALCFNLNKALRRIVMNRREDASLSIKYLF